MKKNSIRVQETDIHLDPRYASARPWDWRVCRTCEALIPQRCPRCGSDKLSDKPKDVIHAALTQFGPPPSLLKG
jgi:ribosomal protein L40E